MNFITIFNTACMQKYLFYINMFFFSVVSLTWGYWPSLSQSNTVTYWSGNHWLPEQVSPNSRENV